MHKKTIKVPNVANPLFEDGCISEKKLGQTIYVVHSGFNGNTERDIATSLIRLIARDSSLVAG